MDGRTNLRVLRKSRRPPLPGDFFVCQLCDDEYIFGRVIATDCEIPPLEGVILIYIYDAMSRDKKVLPNLSPAALLIPPLCTNQLPWIRGYFENVSHAPLQQSDVLRVHCFARTGLNGSIVSYKNEFGKTLSQKVEPCGEYGLHSYRTIDDALSAALGIPLAPD